MTAASTRPARQRRSRQRPISHIACPWVCYRPGDRGAQWRRRVTVAEPCGPILPREVVSFPTPTTGRCRFMSITIPRASAAPLVSTRPRQRPRAGLSHEADARGGGGVEGASTCEYKMRQAGFEPTTSASGGQRSIQLSYWRKSRCRVSGVRCLGVWGPDTRYLIPDTGVARASEQDVCPGEHLTRKT